MSLKIRIQDDVKTAMLQDFKQGIIKAISERLTFHRAVTKTTVLCVGLNQYSSSKISPVPYAAEDAGHLGAAICRETLARTGIDPAALDEVIVGPAVENPPNDAALKRLAGHLEAGRDEADG